MELTKDREYLEMMEKYEPNPESPERLRLQDGVWTGRERRRRVTVPGRGRRAEG